MKKAKMGHELKGLFKKAAKQDFLSLGRLLSLVEKDLKSAAPFLASLKAGSGGVRLGITGPPGAGKSSLLNLLIREFRAQKKSVAVLAVDPSSPLSGGALLGDRVRMDNHSVDAQVFIRSVGARGGFGGLSVATGAMITVLEACGFDVVIVETVGVGQTELQVMNLVDATAVVLVPESGDVIQTMKAGILEMADIFVVNKSDRAGASIMANELKNLAEQDMHKRPVLSTFAIESAREKNGIPELAAELLSQGQALKKTRRNSPERLRGELRNLVLWTADQQFQKKIEKLKVTNVYAAFGKFDL